MKCFLGKHDWAEDIIYQPGMFPYMVGEYTIYKQICRRCGKRSARAEGERFWETKEYRNRMTAILQDDTEFVQNHIDNEIPLPVGVYRIKQPLRVGHSNCVLDGSTFMVNGSRAIDFTHDERFKPYVTNCHFFGSAK